MKRSRKGSAIAFAAALAFALVVLGIGYFLFSMFLGGQNETRNAIDAGLLNIARRVVEDGQASVSVTLTTPDELFFADVCPNPLIPVVNLRNINRVWAKALQVAINADADKAHAGSDQSSADKAFNGAKSISDKLEAKLTAMANLTGFFMELAGQNSVRMIGSNATVSVNNNANEWQTSCMDRNIESNIEVVPNNPPNYTLPSNFTTPCTRFPMPSGAQGKVFLKGYEALNAANHDFFQVSYGFDQKPHLVSGSLFNAATPKAKPVQGWSNPVPNAFSGGGSARRSGGLGERGMSWAETNPRQIFPMQVPHGFIRVVLEQNDLNWTLTGLPVESDNYNHGPDDRSSFPIPVPFICETVQGDCTCGVEYFPQNLFQAMFTDVPGNTFDYVFQRCNEIVPGISKAKVLAVLNTCMVSPSESEQTFYIYSLDGQNILATPDNLTVLPLDSSKSGSPEGNGFEPDFPLILPDLPNNSTEIITCNGAPSPGPPPITVTTITRTWKAGTGRNGGCLGQLNCHHTIDVALIPGPCTCPP